MGGGGGANVQNTKSFHRFFWTGFCSSETKQYSGSLFCGLGLILLCLTDCLSY
jgi:hypothetical protein